MNAKEEIIRMLKQKLPKYDDITNCGGEIIKLHNLIAATEQAIFDVPSEEEIISFLKSEFCVPENWDKFDYKIQRYSFNDIEIALQNFILNYKKPESDEQI